MAQTHTAPSKPNRTVQIGLVLTDQRTGDHRQVIYADAAVVLTRDETGSTTLTPRRSFETELGTRYRVTPDADPAIDAGQYDRLRDRLAEYDAREGRKAKHKADALREALDLLAGDADDGSAPGEPDDGTDGTTDDRSNGDSSAEGESATADGTSRTADGASTTADDKSTIRDAEVPFEEIAGVGPATVGNLRSHGIVTVSDVEAASDEVLGSVSGVGSDTLTKIREFVA